MLNRACERAGPLEALVDDLQAIMRAATSEAAAVARVALRLGAAGRERRWLLAECRHVEPKTYRQQLLYVAPDRCFSIVALMWGAGAQTPIHDHAGWCAVTVYEGVEHEKRYRLRASAQDAGAHDADGTRRPYLEQTASQALEPGTTLGMVADGRDIHRVGNYSNGVTLSLHVYGVDIERTGTSIKSRFDDFAVRA